MRSLIYIFSWQIKSQSRYVIGLVWKFYYFHCLFFLVNQTFVFFLGTAPICRGSCETGEFVAATNAFGDGIKSFI